MPTIADLLMRLAEDGGGIVCTSALTEDEIEKAREDGRMAVLDDGIGYVILSYCELGDVRLKNLVMQICKLTTENMRLKGEL